MDLKAPDQPDPPVVGKVTHHSIELTWSPPHHQPEAGRVRFCVQEEEGGKGFSDVYIGYSTHKEFTGLNTLTQYNYRLRAINDVGLGPWSTVTTVATTRQPRSCENLHRAIQRGDIETAQNILEANPHFIDIPDMFGSSPLMSACKTGNKKMAELLLDLGANVEYQNSSGKTSLMKACYHGQLECVKVVVGGGASWKTRDHSGFSSLHWAVDGGHISVVNFALTDGAPVDDVDVRTLSGWTPLMRTACMGGNAAVARVLVEHGADINRRDKEGKTTLMLAALNGFEDLTRLLLESGADPLAKNQLRTRYGMMSSLAKNQYGKTALDFAESFDREGVLKLLQVAVDESKETHE